MSEQTGRTGEPATGGRGPVATGSPSQATVPAVDVEIPGDAPESPREPEPSGRRASLWGDAWRQLRRNPIFIVAAAIILLFAVMAAFPGLFTSGSPLSADLARTVERPSAQHWFGFDIQGRDYYTRVIYGARVSMTIGILVVGGAAVIALIFGSIAGYVGGVTDSVLSRVADIWFALPTILAAIAFLSVIGERGLAQVSIILTLFAWPTMMRIARSAVLAEREREYVEAARALGASPLRIMARHILPNALAPVIVYGTILVGVVITVEATLSFLGVGLQLPNISWGLMINTAQSRVTTAPHLLLFPGGFLSLTVFGFILMGDALRDALDPKLR